MHMLEALLTHLLVLQLLVHYRDVLLGVCRLMRGIEGSAVVHITHPEDVMELLGDIDVLVARAGAAQDLHDGGVAVLAMFHTLETKLQSVNTICR